MTRPENVSPFRDDAAASRAAEFAQVVAEAEATDRARLRAEAERTRRIKQSAAMGLGLIGILFVVLFSGLALIAVMMVRGC